jgi:DNA sulfur modification protein DndB
MAYILHRNQANSELMPTYQRLIKKSRLKEGRFIR